MRATEASQVTQQCGVLRHSEIKRLLEAQGLIENADPQCIQPASYDVRVGKLYWLPGGKEIHTLDERGIIEVPPQGVVMIQSVERFHLPPNIVGHTGPRRHLALRLMELRDSGAQIDPGYEAHLFSVLRNASADVQHLGYSQPYATVEFKYTTSAKPKEGGCGKG